MLQACRPPAIGCMQPYNSAAIASTHRRADQGPGQELHQQGQGAALGPPVPRAQGPTIEDGGRVGSAASFCIVAHIRLDCAPRATGCQQRVECCGGGGHVADDGLRGSGKAIGEGIGAKHGAAGSVGGCVLGAPTGDKANVASACNALCVKPVCGVVCVVQVLTVDIPERASPCACVARADDADAVHTRFGKCSIDSCMHGDHARCLMTIDDCCEG